MIVVKAGAKARCAICGAPIGRSSRPYGGYVCHRCLSMGLKLAVRLR